MYCCVSAVWTIQIFMEHEIRILMVAFMQYLSMVAFGK